MKSLRRADKHPPGCDANCRLKGSGIIAVFLVASTLLYGMAFGLAKLHQSAFAANGSNKIALQAQQYAESKSDIIRITNYNDLTAQAKQHILDSDFSDEVIIGPESDYNSTIKQRLTKINVYYKDENKPRVTLNRPFYSTSQSSGFGEWINNFPSSGVAPTDGIITASSGFNSGLSMVTGGVERVSVSGRSKYGQGYVTATSPVKKGESYSVGGARYIRFLKIGT